MADHRRDGKQCEIEDEHRVSIEDVRSLGEGRFEVDGAVPIHELETDHGLDLPTSDAYVTVAGLVLEQLGHIPTAGETLTVGAFRLTVLALDGPRIARLRIEPVATPAPAPE